MRSPPSRRGAYENLGPVFGGDELRAPRVLLVTTVMCAFDVTFMGDRPRGQRPARGAHLAAVPRGPSCRFAVLETDDPLARYTDALETRFVDRQPSA
jgi:hypothetical protein